MQRGLYLFAGSVMLVLAAAGVVLPLLPTTPFLLVGSYCFARSSPRMHAWMINHPWFGPYLDDWYQHRGVRRSVKVLAVCMVLAVVASSWLLGDTSAILRWSLSILAGVGLIVIWRLPVVSSAPEGKTNSTRALEAHAELTV